MNTTDLRRGARGLEDLLLVGEGVVQDHRRGREIAEHELVALLGDRRGGRDVDDVGDALLLGDLRDRGALAGVERADQELRAVRDQLLGARARDLDVGLGVGIHDLQVGQAEILQDRPGSSTPRKQSWPMLGLQAGARQQHADFQRAALRAHDRGRGEQRCGGGAGEQMTAGETIVSCDSSLEDLAANLEALARTGQVELLWPITFLPARRSRGKQPLDPGRDLEQAAVVPVAARPASARPAGRCPEWESRSRSCRRNSRSACCAAAACSWC